MVKKPAVLWLLPAGAAAGWAETRGAWGLCWASLAQDQKQASSPVRSGGIQHCMAWQTRSFISFSKPSTTLSAVMLIWCYSLIAHLLLCWMESLPLLLSPQSHTNEVISFQGARNNLLGSAPCWVQTEALNKSMHHWGYIRKWWGKPSGGAVLSADIRVGREIIWKLFWTSTNAGL